MISLLNVGSMLKNIGSRSGLNGLQGRIFQGRTLAMVLCALFGLAAHSVVVAKEFTIAVVDPVVALSETAQAKAMLEQFKREAGPEAQQARKLEDELKSIIEQSQKDADIMSAAQRDKLQKEVEDKKMDYNFLRQKLQKRQQEGRDKILQALGPKFEAAMNQIIKEGRYDVILHKQAVFHSAPTLDITQSVTKKINSMK